LKQKIAEKIIEDKNNACIKALKEGKRLCNEFGFTAEMLKGSLAGGRRKS